MSRLTVAQLVDIDLPGAQRTCAIIDDGGKAHAMLIWGRVFLQRT